MTSVITDTMRLGGKARGKVMVTVSGYAEDKRGLCTIPEFQAWCEYLYNNQPHWVSLLFRDMPDFAYQYFFGLMKPRSLVNFGNRQMIGVDDANNRLQEFALNSLLKDQYQCYQFGISAVQRDGYNQLLFDWIMNLPTTQGGGLWS